MNFGNRFRSGEFRSKRSGRIRANPTSRDRCPADDPGADITAIAHAEGWLIPPASVERVALRPWQQAVFWGLRVYIGIMLVIMGWGLFHAVGG